MPETDAQQSLTDLHLHKRGTLWTIGIQASKGRFIEFEMSDEVACHVREFLEGVQCSHCDAESTQPHNTEGA